MGCSCGTCGISASSMQSLPSRICRSIPPCRDSQLFLLCVCHPSPFARPSACRLTTISPRHQQGKRCRETMWDPKRTNHKWDFEREELVLGKCFALAQLRPSAPCAYTSLSCCSRRPDQFHTHRSAHVQLSAESRVVKHVYQSVHLVPSSILPPDHFVGSSQFWCTFQQTGRAVGGPETTLSEKVSCVLSNTTLRQGLKREPLSSEGLRCQLPWPQLLRRFSLRIRIITSRAVCPEESFVKASLSARTDDAKFLQKPTVELSHILHGDTTHEKTISSEASIPRCARSHRRAGHPKPRENMRQVVAPHGQSPDAPPPRASDPPSSPLAVAKNLDAA